MMAKNEKLIFLLAMFFNIVASTSIMANDPLSAIDWLSNSDENVPDTQTDKLILQKEQSGSKLIQESDILSISINGFGIIPAERSNLSNALWESSDETTLAKYIKEFKEPQLYQAKKFFKQILLTEANPPIVDLSSETSGKSFLIARIDKLIEIGALDEAEAILFDVMPSTQAMFKRWIDVALLTNRLEKMCKLLEKKPLLSNNLSVKVICFAHLGHWNIAALTLSNAAALNRIDKKREAHLIAYLDPKTKTPSVFENVTQPDTIEFFLMDKIGYQKLFSDIPDAYQHFYITNALSGDQKLKIVEDLTRSISISPSLLFSIYKSNDQINEKEMRLRKETLKTLSIAIQKKNIELISTTLSNAIKAMSDQDLLYQLADEYASQLAEIGPIKDSPMVNEEIAKLIALTGNIPTNWKEYKPISHELAFSFSIISDKFLAKPFINTSLQSTIIKGFKVDEVSNIPKQPNTSQELYSQGVKLLSAIELLQDGLKTPKHKIEKSIALLNNLGQNKIAKMLVIELLVKNLQNDEKENYAK